MKKIFFLFALMIAIGISQSSAQGGGDQAQMAQRYKERVKPQLLEKVKLSDTQADKVLEIQLDNRQQMRGLRDLSEAERTKKIAEMQLDMEKQYKTISLTDDQIKSVNEFFEELRKNMGNQRRNG